MFFTSNILSINTLPPSSKYQLPLSLHQDSKTFPHHLLTVCFWWFSVLDCSTCVMSLYVFSTFWSFCKLCNPINPALPGFSKDLCSIHLLHGLPHPRTPLGDITNRFTQGHTIKSLERRHQAQRESLGVHLHLPKTIKSRTRSTLVKCEVILGNEGVGSPYNHLADQVGVLCCSN